MNQDTAANIERDLNLTIGHFLIAIISSLLVEASALSARTFIMEENHMQQERPPSYTQSHDPQTLNFPAVPTADPPPIHHDRTLPPLPSALPERRFRPEEHQVVWPSQNPLTAYYQPGPAQLSPKGRNSGGMDSPTTMELDTPESRSRRGGSVLSIDDPDVRLAAEALGDLRAGKTFELWGDRLANNFRRFCTVTATTASAPLYFFAGVLDFKRSKSGAFTFSPHYIPPSNW